MNKRLAIAFTAGVILGTGITRHGGACACRACVETRLPIATCTACGYAPVGVAPTSAEYHRGHRDAHLAKFPNADSDSLEVLARLAERGMFLSPGRSS